MHREDATELRNNMDTTENNNHNGDDEEEKKEKNNDEINDKNDDDKKQQDITTEESTQKDSSLSNNNQHSSVVNTGYKRKIEKESSDETSSCDEVVLKKEGNTKRQPKKEQKLEEERDEVLKEDRKLLQPKKEQVKRDESLSVQNSKLKYDVSASNTVVVVRNVPESNIVIHSSDLHQLSLSDKPSKIEEGVNSDTKKKGEKKIYQPESQHRKVSPPEKLLSNVIERIMPTIVVAKTSKTSSITAARVSGVPTLPTKHERTSPTTSIPTITKNGIAISSTTVQGNRVRADVRIVRPKDLNNEESKSITDRSIEPASSGSIKSGGTRRWFRAGVSDAAKSTLEMDPDDNTSQGADPIRQRRDVLNSAGAATSSSYAAVTKNPHRSSDELFGRPFYPPADDTMKSYPMLDIHTMISGVSGFTNVSTLTDASSNLRDSVLKEYSYFEEDTTDKCKANYDEHEPSNIIDENHLHGLRTDLDRDEKHIRRYDPANRDTNVQPTFKQNFFGAFDNESVTSTIRSMHTNNEMEQSFRTTKTTTSSSIDSSIMSDLSGTLHALDLAPTIPSSFASSAAATAEIDHHHTLGRTESLALMNPAFGTTKTTTIDIKQLHNGDVKTGILGNNNEDDGLNCEVEEFDIDDHDDDDNNVKMLMLPDDDGGDYSFASGDDTRHFADTFDD